MENNIIRKIDQFCPILVLTKYFTFIFHNAKFCDQNIVARYICVLKDSILYTMTTALNL